jgi:hypothetical protein
MKISFKKLSTLLLSTVFAFSIAACSEGPAEEAGEKLDELSEDAGEMVDDAGNSIEDACENLKDAAEAKDKDC